MEHDKLMMICKLNALKDKLDQFDLTPPFLYNNFLSVKELKIIYYNGLKKFEDYNDVDDNKLIISTIYLLIEIILVNNGFKEKIDISHFENLDTNTQLFNSYLNTINDINLLIDNIILKDLYKLITKDKNLKTILNDSCILLKTTC